MSKIEIYYTGDLAIPDGSDTGVYGDPCEEGMGETLESGWVDPDLSLGRVLDSRDDVRPDVWSDDDGDPVDWVVKCIRERLNGIEPGELGTFYATDSTGPWDSIYTGVTLMMAAHVYGLSDDQLDDASRRLS